MARWLFCRDSLVDYNWYTKCRYAYECLNNVQITDEVEAINNQHNNKTSRRLKSIVSCFMSVNNRWVWVTKLGDHSNCKWNRPRSWCYFSVDIVITYVNGTVNNKLIVQANSYGTAFSDGCKQFDVKTKPNVKKKSWIVTTYHKVCRTWKTSKEKTRSI